VALAFDACRTVSHTAREPVKLTLAGRLVFGFLPAPSHGRGRGFESPPLHHRPYGAISKFDSHRGRAPSLRVARAFLY
jgi:hypothetical protein